MSKAPLDIVCIDKTKLDESFPDFQFHMENYQFPPFWRDQNSKGGGKLVFVKNGLIAKRVKDLEKKKYLKQYILNLQLQRKSGVFYLLIHHLNKTTSPFSKKSQIV